MSADRPHLEARLSRFAGQEDVQFVQEGCTEWRYMVKELRAVKTPALVRGSPESGSQRQARRPAQA